MNLKIDLKSLVKRKPKAEDAESQDGQSASNDSLKNAAIWVKAHFLIVGMGTGSLVALAAGIYFSTELLAGLSGDAAQYGGKLSELNNLERTPVTITVPGSAPISANTVVSKKLVEAVKSRMGSGAVDPTAVRAKAVAHNRGVHTPLVNLRLAAKDPKRADLPRVFVSKLVEGYERLLTTALGAGLPPAEQDVMTRLQRHQVRFVQSDLKKAPDAVLTESERVQLVAELTAYRIALYAEAADGLRVYAAPQDIGARTAQLKPEDRQPSMVELWDMQSQYWIVEDVLTACASLNGNPSVRHNPIKAILKLDWRRPVTAAAEVAGDSQGGSDAAGSGGEGGGGDAPPSDLADASPSGESVDPSQAVGALNYAGSLKGWATNQLYDVATCKITMVVETSEIPRVADALGQQNFIAITDVEVTPTDAFAGLEQGYFYGEAPVSRVTFTLESVWLREWTGPLMPDEVRALLKTTGQLAGAPSTDAGATKEN